MKQLLIFLTNFLVILSITQPVFAVSDKYLWEKPDNQTITGADPLIEELNLEVKKLIDKGQVEPAYFNIGLGGEFLNWSYPGEVVYSLSQSLPFLDEPLKSETINYINNLISNHSPITKATLYNNGGCCVDTLDGNRREFFPLDPNIQLNLWPPASVPLDGIYMLWEYADKTDNWDYISQNWSEIVNLYNNTATSLDTIGEIAGTIGMARLAHTMKQLPYSKSNAATIENETVTKASNALEALNFVAEAREEQSTRGRQSFNWTYPVFCYEQGRNILIGCFFSKEVGRYLSETQKESVRTEVSPYIGNNTPHGIGYDPGWFLSRSDYSYYEYHYGTRDEAGGPGLGHENSLRTPDWSWTWYMIRAHILKDDPQTLAMLVDTPQAIGDLYHMQKLVSAIEAHGQECWTDVRTDTTTCVGSVPSPNPSPGPTSAAQTSCQQADINQDSIVDLTDYSLLATNFLSTTPSVPRADINSDGIVDLTDYSLLAVQFLQICN